MLDIPSLVLCKYRILGIVSQTLHIIEEFSEIQRCYFGTKKELATLFSTRHLFQMVILSDIWRNSFHSITEPCIIFEFFAAYVPLDFCTFMSCFGCYYFCNPLINLRLALILIRTAYTLLMQKGNGTLIALFHIRTAFRWMAGWTSEDFCSLFVKFKISKDIRSWFPCQACGNQFDVFISCKLCVFCSAVCTIRNYNSPLFLFIHLLKVFLDKLTVTVVVLLILILCYNRTIGSNGFLKIGYISPMLFSCLASECSFRIRRILHHGWFHAAVFFCPESALFIFNNGLFWKASDKQIILCWIIVIRLTQGKEFICIR